MTDDSTIPTILVPVAIFDGETVPPGVIDLLGDVHAVLAGYKVLPEQTPPGQARMQFEDRGQELLDDIADLFREAGASVDTRLVFTQDEEKTIDRLVEEIDCDGTLLVQPAPDIEEVYVALWDVADAKRIDEVLGPLLGKKTPAVTLRFLDRGQADHDAATAAMETITEGLVDGGVDRDAISTDMLEADFIVNPIANDAQGADVVVMADPKLTIAEFILGDIEDRLAAKLLAPVLVVHREREEPEEETGEKEEEA